MNISRRLLVSAAILVAAASTLAAGSKIRKPAWAGQFYDADPGRLAARVDAFLDAGAASARPGRSPLVIISPHAGYPYSGGVAGLAYAAVRGADYETVVIVAPSHRVAFEGCSIDALDGYETPLGVAAIDTDLATLMRKESRFGYVPEAHASEHAVEVQVPFIQRALPEAKIVPVIMGRQEAGTVRELAELLDRVSKAKKILVVASTDMSHFLTKKEANVLDASTIDLVKKQATGPLLRKVERGENILCGGGPVVAALEYARKRGPARVDILGYADSSDVGTPESSVVGYFAAAVYSEAGSDASFSLSRSEKAELLRLARRAIRQAVETRTSLDYQARSPNLKVPKGVFVTLTEKGSLRGCIGFIDPIFPLWQAVVQAASYAALEDRRFEPVSRAELNDLEVEISVLSPLTRLEEVKGIQVGRHGLVVEQGNRKGLLLPQVATENGWDRDEFLKQACLKAGLPSDAWKKGAAVYTFEAVVFR
jgi:AmmeMemoRadiSam system protein B/AmmeMemoRadiSam system protein A